jgi:protein-disulfide isomerase
MTSGKQARRQRQAQVARPPVRSTEGRRASPAVLLGALAGLAGLAVAIVLIVVFAGGNSGSGSTTTTVLPDASFVTRQFAGIPQQGNVLGKASAPATMVEYIDLQCPVCRAFETDVMPTVITRYVRTGKLRVEARPVAIIGDGVDSQRGRLGMIAAEQQNRGFNFAQILYFNQGPEDGGWLDDTMVASAARSIPGVNVQALVDATKSSAVLERAHTYDREAETDGLTGTPFVLVGKTDAKLTAVTPGSMPDVAAMNAAITAALKRQ